MGDICGGERVNNGSPLNEWEREGGRGGITHLLVVAVEEPQRVWEPAQSLVEMAASLNVSRVQISQRIQLDLLEIKAVVSSHGGNNSTWNMNK